MKNKTQDLSTAIRNAEQNLKYYNTSSDVALGKAKGLLNHIDELLKNSWLIPNEDKRAQEQYGHLKKQIKDTIKDIDDSLK